MLLFEYSLHLNTLFMRFSQDEYENFKKTLIDLSKEFDHVEWINDEIEGAKLPETEVPEFFQILHYDYYKGKLGKVFRLHLPVVQYMPKTVLAYFNSDALRGFLHNLEQLPKTNEFEFRTQMDVIDKSVFQFSEDSKLVEKVVVTLAD